METLLIAYIYSYVVLLAVLDAGAFYYTYGITRIVGAFRGWILLLAFVVIFALQGVASFGLSAALVIFSPAQLDTYLQNANLASLLISGAYNLVLAGVLFSAMFEIHKTFNRVKSKGFPKEDQARDSIGMEQPMVRSAVADDRPSPLDSRLPAGT